MFSFPGFKIQCNSGQNRAWNWVLETVLVFLYQFFTKLMWFILFCFLPFFFLSFFLSIKKVMGIFTMLGIGIFQVTTVWPNSFTMILSQGTQSFYYTKWTIYSRVNKIIIMYHYPLLRLLWPRISWPSSITQKLSRWQLLKVVWFLISHLIILHY